jgi:inner membrane protein YidH
MVEGIGEKSESSVSSELARERSREAADRTLLAWIRTCLSLIAFGFGTAKIVDYVERIDPNRISDPLSSAEVFGTAFIALGTVALLAALLQHVRKVKQMDESNFSYSGVRPLTVVVSAVLLIIGIFAIVALFW